MHPYPCDNVWPNGLTGPFALKAVLKVRVPSHDGVELAGWIGLPDLPAGVRAPVALHSTPYLGDCFLPDPESLAGGCDATPDDPGWWRRPASDKQATHAWFVEPLSLIEHGFAAAFFSVRGTGSSGGCFELSGSKEQEDQRVLVEWLASQPWSNGRVGMGGVSYPGTTPWEAAISGTTALKTIVTAGIVSDLYTWSGTPQGAMFAAVPAFDVEYTASVSLVPPVGGGAATVPEYASVATQRLCPEVIETMTESASGMVGDVRDASYYDPRRLIDRFGNITAGVLLAQGFLDFTTHAYQDGAVWQALTQAPKRQVVGQWGHRFPTPDVVTLSPTWAHSTWEDLLVAWLDFWLKGIGDPNSLRVGNADYQYNGGAWHESASWPPAEISEEVHYLAGDSLSPSPGDATRSFRSAPSLLNNMAEAEMGLVPFDYWAAFCPNLATAAAGAGLTYLSKPLEEPLLLAGNPFNISRSRATNPAASSASTSLPSRTGTTAARRHAPRRYT